MRSLKKIIKTSQLYLAVIAIFAGFNMSLAQELDSSTASPQGIVLDDGSDSIQAQQLFSNYILKNDDGNFSIKLTDSDAKSSLHRLAKEAEVNIVIPEDLDNRININLSDVSFDLALKSILKSTPYRYTLDEGIYFVELASSKHIEAEQVFSKRFPIVNANIDDVYTAIADAYGSDSGSAEATDGDSEAATDAPAEVNVNIILDKSNSAIIAQGSQEVLAQIEDLIKLLDFGPEQVAIEATFVEINLGDSSDTGVDWSAFQSYTASLNFDWEGIFGRDAIFRVGAGDASPNTAVLSSAGNQLLLNFIKNTSDGKIVSNPRIITGSSITAEMSVGTEFPIPEYEVTTTDSGATAVSISGFDYQEIGVILKVTPKVNADRSITLEIEPELSSQIDESFITAGFAIPVISSSKMKTTVTIGNGETIAMGGLIQTEETDSISKVPFLNKLPVVGKAFQSSSKSYDRKNLMIFVTARLISAKGSLSETLSDAEINELGINKNDFLPYDKREKKKLNFPLNLDSNAKKVEAREVSEVRSTSF